jgi:hypothetical protein
MYPSAQENHYTIECNKTLNSTLLLSFDMDDYRVKKKTQQREIRTQGEEGSLEEDEEESVSNIISPGVSII